MNNTLYLYDNQLGGYITDQYGDPEHFANLQAIYERLASYHDNDFTDERYDSIYEYLDTLPSITHKVNWLLEYGDWSILDDEEKEHLLS